MAFLNLHKKILVLLNILLTATVTLTEAQNVIPPEVKVEIDTILESWMTSQHIPGLGLAITKGNGEILYSQGYGYRDVENGLPAQNATLFGIGSITKSFAATVVVKKLSEMYPGVGAAILDVPIRYLAPEYRGNFTLIDRFRSQSTTFRDLLSHKLCTLPELTGMWVQVYEDMDEFFYRQRYAQELCSFRNGYWYNNGHIAMAGDIIAHMANSTFNDMLSELLIGIGMMDTTWVKESDDHNNMMGRSVPYLWKDGELIRYNPELLKSVVIVNAAGGILSSANDMVKYMQFHLNHGKVGDEQLVSEEAMIWLRTISNTNAGGTIKTEDNVDATIDLTIGYGLCLNVGVYDGWLRVEHGGYIPPYESLMSFYPSLNLGIFITINGPGTLYYSGGTPTNIISNQIFDIVQGNGRKSKTFTTSGNGANLPGSALTSGPYPVVRNTIQENNMFQIKQLSTPEIQISPEDAVGVYGNGLNGEMSIELRTNDAGVEQLFWEYGVWGQGWLTQVANETFRIEWTSDFWMMSWGNGLGALNATLNFLDLDTLQYLEEGVQSSSNFERDLDLDDLPEVPWTPDSCAQDL